MGGPPGSGGGTCAPPRLRLRLKTQRARAVPRLSQGKARGGGGSRDPPTTSNAALACRCHQRGHAEFSDGAYESVLSGAPGSAGGGIGGAGGTVGMGAGGTGVAGDTGVGPG